MGFRPTHRDENGVQSACPINGVWTAMAVYTLDVARPFLSLTWDVRFEPICVAPPILGGST
jgi:hypothetical protein